MNSTNLIILVIEDDEDIREGIAEILEIENYKVECACNGLVGLETARRILPDLILCDISMPELDGYKVCELLKNNTETAGIPFIFLTAKSEKKDEEKARALRSEAYLIKPFDDIKLLATVNTCFKKFGKL